MLFGKPRPWLLWLPLWMATGPWAFADPPPYRVAAGNFAPFTQEKGPAAPGALTELVQLMSARLGQPVTVEFYPWQRAQNMPKKLSRVAVLPMTRLPEREADYVWLVPLYYQDFLFIRKAANVTDKSPSIEPLRGLKLGSVRGTACQLHLRRHQFARVAEANNHDELWRMLDKGLIDAICGSRAVEGYNMRLLGYSAADFYYGPSLEKGEIWLAGSKDFTQADVEAWQSALKAIKREGIYAQVLKKYGLPE